MTYTLNVPIDGGRGRDLEGSEGCRSYGSEGEACKCESNLMAGVREESVDSIEDRTGKGGEADGFVAGSS